MLQDSSSALGDQVAASAGYQRGDDDTSALYGFGVAEVHGPDGELKASVPFTNLITQVGEQRYGEAGGLGDSGATVAKPATMQLGTGTAAPVKSGTGDAIGTVVANSVVAIGTPTSALSSGKRQITYTCTWAAGTATANAISEVVLTNQGVATQTAAPEAATLSRALLSPTVNKGSSDSLTITWNHVIGT